MSTPVARAFDAVRRLSQYRPFERGGASSREAVDDLVCACLAEADGQVGSIEECANNAKTLFTIELHEVEIARSLGDLIKHGRVERFDGGFRLTANQREHMESTAGESSEIATQAIREWRDFLANRWPGLSGVQLDSLEADLQLFLKQVLYRHGAEAAVLLYPDLPEAQKVYDEVEEMGLDFLPAAPPEIRGLRSGALSHFVRRPTEMQKLWLGLQLNTMYFWSVLSIDPAGALLIREQATGQRVYLDTNLVYRLLGVQGPRYVRPAETLVKTTQEVGYECCVTPWTIREFRASLKKAADFLKLHPLPSSEYADLLAEATSDDDFVTAYWRRVKETNLKAEDFVAHYEEVEVNLKRFNITVAEEGCTAVEQRKEDIADEVSILGGVLHGRLRSPEPIEHDVKHRLLVRQLRGASDRRFANAGYWFLTFDSVLPRYDVHARRGEGGDLPFCVSGGSWFQIVEALRPKSEDDLQMLADLLASPYVRNLRVLSKEVAQEIAARVALHESGTPELAARVMMNSAFADEIEAAGVEERVEKIDNAIIAAAQQAQDDARLAQKEAEKAREDAAAQRARAEEEAAQREARHAAELRDREERIQAARRDEADRAETKLADERRRATEELEAQKAKTLDAQAAEARQKRRLRLVVALIGIAVVVFVGLLAVGLSGLWSVLVVVATVATLWGTLDHYWIQRQ